MPSENDTASVSENQLSTGVVVADRRTRKREARREHLLDLAAELVDRDGVDGLTMAALAGAADYATASLYTYFPSRSALLAELQQRALTTLSQVGEDELRRWDDRLRDVERDAGGDAELDALTRLWAFAGLLLTAPEHHPFEFRLQQQLLVTPGAEDVEDAARVVPAAMLVIDLPRRLLDAGAASGALEPAQDLADPVGAPLDGTIMRTFAWLVALNGALLVDGLATGLPSTGRSLGEEITSALLRGWGADPARCDAARRRAHDILGEGAPS